MSEQEVLNQIVIICRKHHATSVILFGSRAKGTARKTSDFDIAVAGVSPFWKLEEAMEQIPTLYSIDVINLDSLSDYHLLEEVRKYGKVL